MAWVMAVLKVGETFTMAGVRVKKPWWRFWERQSDYPLQPLVVTAIIRHDGVKVFPDAIGMGNGNG